MLLLKKVVLSIDYKSYLFRWFLTTLLVIVNFSSSLSQVVSSADSLNNASSKNIQIKEIQVDGRYENKNITEGSNGLSISIKDIKQLPKFIGESDPYKALQYMGGVSQAGEANSGLYVRGGNNDQNLILFNGIQIFNPTHVMGMFSIFNPDLIGQLQFYKSGIPAEYGSKLSSVVDLKTTNFIPDKITLDGSIGFISTRIACTIPLSDKLSIYGSIRGSYIGIFILPILSEVGVSKSLTSNKFDFYDINGGFSSKIAKRTFLNGTFYTGNDIIQIRDYSKSNFSSTHSSWSNLAYGLQLNHVFNENWSMSHGINNSNFSLNAKFNWFNSDKSISNHFGIITYHSNFSFINDNHHLKFGVEISKNNIYPNKISSDSTMGITVNSNSNIIQSVLLSSYIRDELTINKWLFNIGIRTNYYCHLGPFTDYQSSEKKYYQTNQIIKSYPSIEPRIFARYLVNNSTSLKISISRHNQFLNQVPVFSLGLPADIQVPASYYVQPQSMWQYSTGIFKNLVDNTYEISLETYYKSFENQLEFKNGIESTFSNGNIEKSLLLGKGWAYGSELKVRKAIGQLSGWISYNLAWNYRKFAELNYGNPFFARNDRRHDLSIILMYKLNEKISFTSLFVYATGNRINLPVSWFIVDNVSVLEYDRYNSSIMEPYHRLDLSMNYKLNDWRGIKSELNFSIYNVYNHANPFQIYLGSSGDKDNVNMEVKKAYLLPIIPSISWIFHF
jgi:hypothetical protein